MATAGAPWVGLPAVRWRFACACFVLMHWRKSQVCILGSLEAFDEAGGMSALVRKQRLLTGYFEALIQDRLLTALDGPGTHRCEILTPADPARRGCQITLRFPDIQTQDLEDICTQLEEEQHIHLGTGSKFSAVIFARPMIVASSRFADLRKPNVLRLAPVPLYCRFIDCWHVVESLTKVVAVIISNELVNY